MELINRAGGTEEVACAENVGRGERVLSTLTGAWMIAWGVTRALRSPWALMIALAGGPLIRRGATGRSALYRALGVDTERRPSRRPGVEVSRAESVQGAALVRRPIGEVYAFWRDLENLPQFMAHLETVARQGHGGWYVVAEGPLGRRLSWEADVVQDMANQRIAWRSRVGSELANEGYAEFRETPSGDTEVFVCLTFEPFVGKLGLAAARLVGRDPQRDLDRDLERMRRILEARPEVRAEQAAPALEEPIEEEEARSAAAIPTDDPAIAEARRHIADERKATIQERADFESDQSFPASDAPARY